MVCGAFLRSSLESGRARPKIPAPIAAFGATIINSYATGNVSVAGAADVVVGGFVGAVIQVAATGNAGPRAPTLYPW